MRMDYSASNAASNAALASRSRLVVAALGALDGPALSSELPDYLTRLLGLGHG